MQDFQTPGSPPSRVHFIGGEKGGVGKSMVSRLLAQYFIDRQMPFVGFDTDRSHGALLRFYSEFAFPARIDRYEALDLIVEAALETPGQRVLVDLAAQTDAELVKWINESGVIELAAEGGFVLTYWHVMDSGYDSVQLLSRLLDQFGARIQYVVVKNPLRGGDFGQLERSGQLERAVGLGAKIVTLKRLHDAVVQKMDASNSSFWAAQNLAEPQGAGLGLMERQRLKQWQLSAYGEFDRASA